MPAPTTTNLAGDLITSVRDLIPDPSYDSGGTPLPDADGTLFRASTLYRWLDRAVKVTTDRIGWAMVDWYAMSAVTGQPFYPIDSKWVSVEYAWAKQFLLPFLNEAATIYPSAASTSQPLTYSYHRRTDHLEVGFFPSPNYSDPTTTLNGALASSGVDPIVLTSTADFQTKGFVQVDNEFIQYQSLSTSPVGIATITRGCCGTAAASHLNGASVFADSLWIKGRRAAQTISSSTSSIELPSEFNHALEMYLISRCRASENDDQSSQGFYKQYSDEVERIAGDPAWRRQPAQVAAYGEQDGLVTVYGLIVP